MTHDELARKRAKNARKVAGAKRRPPPVLPGDAGVMAQDLEQIAGMSVEVLAEANALGEPNLIGAVEQLLTAAERALTLAHHAKAEGG